MNTIGSIKVSLKLVNTSAMKWDESVYAVNEQKNEQTTWAKAFWQWKL